MKKHFTIIILFFAGIISTFANDIRQVEGYAVYYAPRTGSPVEAEFKALQLAIINALAKEFRTNVTSIKTLTEDIKDGNFQKDFTSLSSTEVKGEWIETIGEPVYNITHNEKEYVVKVSVKGLARKISPEKIYTETHILRNSTKDNAEDTHFNAEDRFFVSFQTPEAGYCSIYYVDKYKNVYCLLPYPKMAHKPIKVIAGKRYVFFSHEENTLNEVNSYDIPDCLVSCEGEFENNMIYIVFSPNRYSLATTEEIQPGQPGSLSFKKFQKWLTERRKNDLMMNVTIKNIFINPTKQN